MLEPTAMLTPEPLDEIPSNGMSAVDRALIEKQSNEDRERSILGSVTTHQSNRQ